MLLPFVIVSMMMLACVSQPQYYILCFLTQAATMISNCSAGEWETIISILHIHSVRVHCVRPGSDHINCCFTSIVI